MQFHWVKNLKLKDIEIRWDDPEVDTWQSAITIENAAGVEIDGFNGRQAWVGRDVPALVLKNVSDAMIRDSQAPEGTSTFLKVAGREPRHQSLRERPAQSQGGGSAGRRC